MDLKQIQKFLPHRYPLLLVDRVVELVPDQKLRAYKNVTFNEEFFQGHFPGHPVMPGVLIVEALAQASGLLALQSVALQGSNKVMYLMSLDQVKFRKPVVPGDRLDLEITMLRQKRALVKVRGEAKVDGVVVAEAEIMATILDAASVSAPTAG